MLCTLQGPSSQVHIPYGGVPAYQAALLEGDMEWNYGFLVGFQRFCAAMPARFACSCQLRNKTIATTLKPAFTAAAALLSTEAKVLFLNLFPVLLQLSRALSCNISRRWPFSAASKVGARLPFQVTELVDRARVRASRSQFCCVRIPRASTTWLAI